MYLFRISTKQKDAWSRIKPRPVYFVARDKEAAEKWANENLHKDLMVSKIIKLASQNAAHIFIGL